MSHVFSRSLIILVIVAFAGITAVQGLWIHSAFYHTELHIREVLNKALREAVEDLNAAEEIAFIAQVSSGADSLQQTNVHKKFMVVSNTQRSADSTFFRQQMDSLHKKLNIHLDSMGGKGQKERVIRLEYTNDGPQEKVETHLEWQEDSLMSYVLSLEHNGRLHEVVKRIQKENIHSERGWKNRLDSATLYEKIKKHLEMNGIGGPFEFAVLDEKMQPFDGFVSSGFKAGEEGASTKTPLFPGDLRTKNLFAAVQVPSLLGHVMAQLWWLVLASAGFTGLMVVLFVITIRKLLSQNKLSQLKTDFINNMSHELKTPLATISLAADAIRHPAVMENKSKVQEFVSAIKKEHQRMSAHIERILQMAQSEEGKFTLEKTSCDLGELIGELIDDFALITREAGAVIHFQKPPAPVVATADAFHIKAALANLLDNAIKYNSGQPEVHVTLHATGRQAAIKVCDNGVGIGREQQKQVFSRFYRVQSGNIQQVKGFGLGLSYVLTVVQAHGGKVELESELGRGSCFTILLPLP